MTDRPKLFGKAKHTGSVGPATVSSLDARIAARAKAVCFATQAAAAEKEPTSRRRALRLRRDEIDFSEDGDD